MDDVDHNTRAPIRRQRTISPDAFNRRDARDGFFGRDCLDLFHDFPPAGTGAAAAAAAAAARACSDDVPPPAAKCKPSRPRAKRAPAAAAPQEAEDVSARAALRELIDRTTQLATAFSDYTKLIAAERGVETIVEKEKHRLTNVQLQKLHLQHSQLEDDVQIAYSTGLSALPAVQRAIDEAKKYV